MSVINGTDLYCFIEGVSIAHATSHTLSIKTAVIPTSNKDTGLYSTKIPGRSDVTVTCEGFIAYGDFETVVNAKIARLPVTLSLGKKTGDTLDSSEPYFTGEFIITSYEMTAADNSVATYNVTFDHYESFQFVAFEPESGSLFTRMTALAETPSAARQTIINTAIKGLKDNGIWAKLDALWVLAAHGNASAYLNWIEAAHNCTLVGAGTFTTDRGWAGNGSSGALNCHYNPSTEGVNLTQNSVSMFIYSRTNNATAVYDMSADNAGVSSLNLLLKHTTGFCYGVMNAAAALQTDAIAASTKMFSGRRNNTNEYIWRDKNQEATGTSASVARVNTGLYIGCQNAMGTLGAYSVREYSFAGIGGFLTNGEIELLYDIMVTGYLTSLGANV